MKANRVIETRIITKETEEYITKIAENPLSVKVNHYPVACDVESDLRLGVVKIKFKYPLAKGDLLSIEYETLKTKYFTRRTKVLFELLSLYSDSQKFKNNTEYKLSVNVFGNAPFVYNFHSMYAPYYTKIQYVRDDVGNLFDSIDDSVIARFIFENSMLAEYLITEERIEEVIGDGTSIPLYVSNYVRYKTDVDLVNAVYLDRCGKVGSFEKILGSLSVSNEYKLPDIEDMLDRFKQLLKTNEDLLNPGVDTPLGIRKARGNEYTVTQRGVF